MFRFLKNSTVLIFLCLTLAFSTATFAAKALTEIAQGAAKTATVAKLTTRLTTANARVALLNAQVRTLNAEVATLKGRLATNAAVHRREMATAVAKQKAKARIRRYMVAIPVLGIVAAGAFETHDYLEWHKEHPNGSKADYACETAEASAQVMDEVLQALPERVRPTSDFVLSYMPKCVSAD